MKCPFCGGEFSSQSIKCPYCGRENPEGIAFQAEVQKRMERNKLLKPFLIRQKKPELVQRLLGRIAIILVAVNVILLAFSLGIYIWSDREVAERVPAEGSFAEQYLQTYPELQNYYYSSFITTVNEIMDSVEKGEMPYDSQLSYVVYIGYHLLWDAQDESEEYREEAELTVTAFFRGYLGMTAEECAFLEPSCDGTYENFLDSDVEDNAAAIVKSKLQEVLP